MCLGIAVVEGIVRGFTEQAIALISIVIGAWMAYESGSVVCQYLQPYIPMPGNLLNVIVFILMVALVIFICRIIGKVIKASINFVMLGWLDRLLGAVFALMKTSLILGILIIIFSSLNETFEFVPEKTLAASDMYMYLKIVTLHVFPYFTKLL